MVDQLEVTHNEQAQCFELYVDGHRAHLDYRPQGEGTLDYYHTFVPTELRGRSIAGLLTKAALEYAQEHGFKVLPSCSYVEVFIRRQASAAKS